VSVFGQSTTSLGGAWRVASAQLISPGRKSSARRSGHLVVRRRFKPRLVISIPSEVVRRAAAGEVVEINDRARRWRLVPTARTTLEGLVAAGLARPERLGVAAGLHGAAVVAPRRVRASETLG
jgi:hypothetical protein